MAHLIISYTIKTDSIMKMDEAITLLKSYNGPFELTLHTGANEALIKDVEKAYGIKLPQDFKCFYLFTNGFEMDEDIFNMIPLSEMISNNKDDKHPSIAEYMIYSDKWHLEINNHDPNQYEIYVLDYDSEKIVLTNSLAEFIARFLKAGVFEIGGLYAWKDEIKAKIHGRTEPTQVRQLIGAWRECLILGLINIEEVKHRADWIIATEDDPHYFFIEISLSRNFNELITLLDSLNFAHDILQIRLVLAAANTALLVDKIVPDKAIAILEYLRWKGHFTDYERNEIDYLLAVWDDLQETHQPQWQTEANERLKDFLNNYSRLSLYNYRLWPSVNARITEVFNNKS